MQPAWITEIQINNPIYKSKEKHLTFIFKHLPSQNIVIKLMFIIWNFIANFKLNIRCLIGIVTPKFTCTISNEYDAGL